MLSLNLAKCRFDRDVIAVALRRRWERAVTRDAHVVRHHAGFCLQFLDDRWRREICAFDAHLGLRSLIGILCRG